MNTTPVRKMQAADVDSLRLAVRYLEHPSLAARLTSFLGTPIEEGFRLLPAPMYDRVHDAAVAVVRQALNVAVTSMPGRDRPGPSRDALHRYLGMGSGAVGGFFGLPGTLAELPLATTLMLRSIADIARAEGEDLSDPSSRLACVEVFAYGGRPREDDAAETGYYGLRLALALHFSTVSARLVERGLVEPALPAVVAMVRGIAARFGVAIGDKVAFQLVPVFGAAAGAIANAVFMDHFQDMARGHFTVRRLERSYGQPEVRKTYEKLRLEDLRQRDARRAEAQASA
ncbi:MAG: EcsC family protein [Gammaproteobacteria bacterium]|jgi:hypothetical protein